MWCHGWCSYGDGLFDLVNNDTGYAEFVNERYEAQGLSDTQAAASQVSEWLAQSANAQKNISVHQFSMMETAILKEHAVENYEKTEKWSGRKADVSLLLQILDVYEPSLMDM